MLWDLGLDATKMEDVEEVTKKIAELERQFDFGNLNIDININGNIVLRFN